MEGMTAASGYFKREIAARIRMRKMPEFIFLPDNSLEYSEHIEKIIAGLPKPVEDTANEEAEEPDEEN